MAEAKKPRKAATSAEAGSPTLVGKSLGPYRITGILGRGGMGVVYEARDAQSNDAVALKILPPEMCADPTMLKRFLLEAQAATRFSHPNAVGVYDVGEIAGLHYIAMELIRGGSAADFLRARGPMNWPEAARIIANTGKALASAHAAGIIHRDIKPANIMRSVEGTVKLADFGLAKVTDATATSITGKGEVIGTPQYMSPEQCMSEPLDVRSDVYSLGATFYALLTGSPPYANAGTTPQIMFAHCYKPAPDPREVNPDLPAACTAVIERAMAKSADDRHQSAGELVKDLELLLEDPSGAMTSPQPGWNDFLRAADNLRTRVVSTGSVTSAVPRLGARRGRSPLPAFAAAFAAVVAAVLVWLAVRGGSNPPPAPPAGKDGTSVAKDGVVLPVNPDELNPDAGDGGRTPGKTPETRVVVKAVPVPPAGVEPTEVFYLTDWAIVGPFPAAGGDDLFGNREPDSKIDLSAEYSSALGAVRWKHVRTANGAVDLLKTVGQRDNALAYAVCFLESVERADVELRLTHDNGCRAKINGGQIYESRNLGNDARSRRFVLQPGRNTIWIKVAQSTGAWAFRVGVCGADGRPVAGLRCVAPEIPTMPLPIDPTVADPARWRNALNLTALVDAGKDSTRGVWRLEKGELECPRLEPARLDFPYVPPDAYDFRIEFTRVAGACFVGQYLSAGGRSFEWTMGNGNNTFSGFHPVGNSPLEDNVTVARREEGTLTNGRRHTAIVQVRPDVVRAYLDNRLVGRWTPEAGVLGEERADMLGRRLGLGACDAVTRFHRAEVLELTGPGRFTRPEDPAALAAEAKRAGPAAGDGHRALALLPLVDPARDAVAGEWSSQADGIVITKVDRNRAAILEVPYYPPAEYDVRMVFTRSEAGGEVAPIVSAAGRQFRFVMDGWAGFEMVRQRRLYENNPTKVRLTEGLSAGRHESVVEVRRDGVRARIDGKVVCEWKTDYRDMGAFSVVKVRDDRLLGVAATRPITVHVLEIVEVTGRGAFTRPEDPAARAAEAKRTGAGERPWEPIFDGKSPDFLSGMGEGSWQVDGGALSPRPGAKVAAAQTRRDFGDGQMRIRFVVIQDDGGFIRIRQAPEGGWSADFDRRQLRAMLGTPQELVFTARGDRVTAELNGRPYPLTVKGAPAAGRLQFAGPLRISAIEWRPGAGP
jgi:hypothetical protein